MGTNRDDGPAMELTNVYVVVHDMDRALSFYRDLFETEPDESAERFTIFSFAGIDFGLYNPSYAGHEVEFGVNCVPSFEVPDAEAAHDRIAEIAPVIDDVETFGDYRTFRLEDTEGNELEVFSIESG